MKNVEGARSVFGKEFFQQQFSLSLTISALFIIHGQIDRTAQILGQHSRIAGFQPAGNLIVNLSAQSGREKDQDQSYDCVPHNFCFA